MVFVLPFLIFSTAMGRLYVEDLASSSQRRKTCLSVSQWKKKKCSLHSIIIHASQVKIKGNAGVSPSAFTSKILQDATGLGAAKRWIRCGNNHSSPTCRSTSEVQFQQEIVINQHSSNSLILWLQEKMQWYVEYIQLSITIIDDQYHCVSTKRHGA